MSIQHQSKTTRSPAIGVVRPNSEVTVTFEIPIEFEVERPYLVTRAPDLTMIKINTSDVVLKNTGKKDALYAVIVLPKLDFSGAIQNLFTKLKDRYAIATDLSSKK